MVTKLTYKSAGVDITAGNELVHRIKKMNQPSSSNLLEGIGGFGALYSLPEGYQQPVLVSSTDGVGTKLKLAIDLNRHQTIGIDLVAMCVNDILVSGAKPLFFLDYFASGHLDVEQAEHILKGVIEGCRQADMPLIGGETAEMPGMYTQGKYDLAGFCVGIVEKNQIINGQKISVGDHILGIASSGVHSNGYSLIRKILKDNHIPLSTPFEESTLGEHLLAPTKIYVQSILNLKNKVEILGLAHITGGGLLENIPRILPEKYSVKLYKNNWTVPSILKWIQREGNLSHTEMYRTFNCGIGMVVFLSEAHVTQAMELLQENKETVYKIGEVVSSSEDEERVNIIE